MFSSILNAENKESKIADKYFTIGDYHNAIDMYKTALDKENDPMEKALYRYRIGISYYRLNDVANAEKNLNSAIKSGYMSAETYIVLGDVQLKLGKLDEAQSSYELYKYANPHDIYIDNKIASVDFVRKNQQIPSLFKLEPVSNKINSKDNEFGISFFNESLLFTSTRNVSPTNDDEEEEIDNPDNFSSKKQQKKRFTKEGFALTSIWISTGTNYNRAEEILELNKMKGFADDGIMIYDPYSRLGYYTNLDGKKAYIYTMKIVDNKWQKSEKIEIQSQGSHVGHPFVTPEGDRIYFTSTMPGGKGKSDIWYIPKIGDKWSSVPINAGGNINTPGNEVYPHVSNGYFFFASDGKIGMGGLDIYASKITNLGFEKAVNLGVPFNSTADDYNIIIRLDKTGGMLVSSRNFKRGSDVYKFDGFPSNITITGTVQNSETNTPVSNASLELFTENKSLNKVVADINGNFVIPVHPNTTYNLKASAPGYTSSAKTFTTQKDLLARINKENGTDLDFDLSGNAAVIVGKVYDKQTSEPLKDITVSLITNGVVQQNTDVASNGIYKFSNLTSNTNYTLKDDPKGYLWDNKNIHIANSNKQTEYSKNNGYDLDFALQKIEIGKEIIIPNIAFQEDKPNLLTESYKELDRLANTIIQNPHCFIHLKGYVDQKSNIAKNLSLYRVNMVRDYLISKGVNSAQLLSPQGMGSQNPLVPNPSSKEERQMNNRITYTVTKIDADKELKYSQLNVTNNVTQPVSQPNTTPKTSTGTVKTTEPAKSQQTAPKSQQTAPVQPQQTAPAQSQQTAPKSQQTTPAQSSKNNAASNDKSFIIQIASGTSLDLKNANYAKITKSLGLEVKYEIVDGKYKYFVGFFNSLDEAKNIVNQLNKIGIKDAWIRRKY
jgi:outer membrane protein OmpA-like peptidoglycan-associated protein/tetratricopeptide (TPR) repeat protein